MVLTSVAIFCFILGSTAYAQQSESAHACQKLQECIQIAHDQTHECRQLLSKLGQTQASGPQPQQTGAAANRRESIKQCENGMKDKQNQYLEKLTQKTTHLKACIARHAPATPGTDLLSNGQSPQPFAQQQNGHNNQKRGKKQQNQCRNVDAIELKPAQKYSDAAGQQPQRAGNARKQQKQTAKKLKQCLGMVAAAKAHCKPLTKCCPAAKTCYDEFKTSALNTELEKLKAEFTSGKKSCKGGAGGQGGRGGEGGRRRGGKVDAIVEDDEHLID